MQRIAKSTNTHHIERGDAEVFGLLSFAPVLVALVALIAYAAVARAAQVPVFAAARECVREASAYLNTARANEAGNAAAWGSLLGNHINAGLASVSIGGHAGPGSEVTCTVRYRIDLDNLPMASWLGTRAFNVQSTASAKVELHKSR